MYDGEFGSGNGRLRVQGLAKAVRSMERAGADSQDMKDLMQQLGQMVVRAASPPVVSGRLAGTIRAGKGKTKAVVRAGGARAPHAPIIHYGWPARNIAPNDFLTQALNAERGDILAALDAGLADILSRNNLT